MTAKGDKYLYSIRVKPDTPPILRELAAELGILVTARSKFLGEPSPGDYLDILTEALKGNAAFREQYISLLRAHGVGK